VTDAGATAVEGDADGGAAGVEGGGAACGGSAGYQGQGSRLSLASFSSSRILLVSTLQSSLTPMALMRCNSNTKILGTRTLLMEKMNITAEPLDKNSARHAAGSRHAACHPAVHYLRQPCRAVQPSCL
jgi:hypothetical protein